MTGANNKRKGFLDGPISNQSTLHHELPPWHSFVAVNLTYWRCHDSNIFAYLNQYIIRSVTIASQFQPFIVPLVRLLGLRPCFDLPMIWERVARAFSCFSSGPLPLPCRFIAEVQRQMEKENYQLLEARSNFRLNKIVRAQGIATPFVVY